MDKNVLYGLYYFVEYTFEVLYWVSIVPSMFCPKQDCIDVFSFYMITDFANSIMQSKLIDLSLLSVAEVDWLNDYHSLVWEKVILHIQKLFWFM